MNESEPRGESEIAIRRTASTKAWMDIRNQIAAGQFSIGNAQQIGGDYLSRWNELITHELALFEEDALFATGEDKDLAKRILSENEKTLTKEKERHSGIINEAVQGNYAPMKRYLSVYGGRMARNKGSQEELLGRGLVALSRFLRNSGSAYQPPPPAWQDPRFNTRLNPQGPTT